MSGTLALVLEFAGAIGILIPFALLQAGRLSQHSVGYLALNLVGAAILTVVAVLQRQWGFVILQAAWGAVAFWGLTRRTRRRTAVPPTGAAGGDPRP